MGVTALTTTNLSATRWQKYASPFLSMLFGLLWPSRFANAKSIQGQIQKLSGEQRGRLVALLKKHKIIQPQFAGVLPQNLKHYHFCKVVWEGQIKRFSAEFNSVFEDTFEIAHIAGEFTIRALEAEDADAADSPRSLRDAAAVSTKEEQALSLVSAILDRAPRPLTLGKLHRETKRLLGDTPLAKVSRAEIGVQIGKLLERETIFETRGAKKRGTRYFPHARMDEVLHQTVFAYEKEGPAEAYIYEEEARLLVSRGQIVKTIGHNGHFIFIEARNFEEDQKAFYAEVHAKGESFWVFYQDAPQLLEQGILIRARSEDNFEECYVWKPAQNQHAFLIFNAFSHAYLTSHSELNFAVNYAQLKSAFAARLRRNGHQAVRDLLYEASLIRDMKGDVNTVTAALLRDTATFDRARPALLKSEMAKIEPLMQQSAFVSHFPFLFRPDWQYSLQNFMHRINSRTGVYGVFILVLANKMSKLRALVRSNAGISQAFQREIEMLYAPLAELREFKDLADNMRDLVAKIARPKEYAAAQRKEEEAIGMTIDEARRHLIRVAQDNRDLATNAGSAIHSHTSRVKEVAAILGKEMIEIQEMVDFLGIRYICETLDEADYLAAWLQENLEEAPAHLLPRGKSAIADHLRTPSTSKWYGWRGYFIDPLQDAQEAAGKPRIISFQVLTKEQLKRDRLSKLGHAFYKAERAARLHAKSLGGTYVTQLFDPAPIDQYASDPDASNPEHDYLVDQRAANQHIRTFVLITREPFTASSFVFPADGRLPMLRLLPGASIEDAAAFREFGNPFFPTSEGAQLYEHAELYGFCLEGGKIKLKPHARGQSRVSPGHRAADDTLLVIKVGPKGLSGAALREVEGKATELRTRLLTHSVFSNRNPLALQLVCDGLIKRGKENPLIASLLLLDQNNQRRALRILGLADTREVAMAVGLELIDDATLQKAIAQAGSVTE
ncbi:MAG: hypothetical protein HQ596_03335 [Candidatus Saganbacteria bacterium]|nr:hypothetical protein [Candidatus Saganbacteria bacterium]